MRVLALLLAILGAGEMRTISTAQQQMLDAPGGYRTAVRVKVADDGGAMRDLTTYGGRNWLLGVSYGETVDSNGLTATVRLRRAEELLSLAPLMETSALNLQFVPGGTYAPLLDASRRITIEVQLTPDLDAPSWASPMKVFDGFIDKVRPEATEITLECRDKVAKLVDRWIEVERVYGYAENAGGHGVRLFEPDTDYALNEIVVPSQERQNGNWYQVTTAGTSDSTEPTTWPASGTVTSGGVVFTRQDTADVAAGLLVEDVMQGMIDDNLGSGVFTLDTPSSPGWAIGWFKQERTSLFDALKKLADQIGWALRFRWDGSDFVLTFSEPDRAKTTPDYTFAMGKVKELNAFALTHADIRNVVRVIYSDPADLDAKKQPRRKTIEVTDAPSISRYGRRFMEIAEGSSSNIDTSTEATALANAALSDLSTPGAEMEPVVRFFPFAELEDLYRFEPDNIRFSADQDLAVVGVQHSIDDKSARTTLTVRGKPSSGYRRWLRKEGRVNKEDVHATVMLSGLNNPGVQLIEAIGGAVVVARIEESPRSTGSRYDIHVSTDANFEPDETTLKATGNFKQVAITDLPPDQTHYVRVVPFTENARRVVLGLPSAPMAFTPGQASAGHIKSTVSQAHWPFNGNFEHALRDLGDQPPDHWNVAAGQTWGAGGHSYYGTDTDYGRTVVLRDVADFAALRSSVFPLRRNLGNYNLSVSRKGTGSNAGTAGNGLVVVVRFWKDAAGTVASTNLASRSHTFSSGPASTWQVSKALQQSSPSDANFATIDLAKESNASDYAIEIGDVFFSDGTVESSDWLISHTFSNNWTDYGGSDETSAFCKGVDGFVHLRGKLKRSTGTASANETILTLPSGYRPNAQKTFVVWTDGGANRVEITTAGIMKWKAGGYAELSIEGISFDTR